MKVGGIIIENSCLMFNEWRDRYEEMSYRDNIDFHNQLESMYPNQAHFKADNVIIALDLIGKPFKVLEFGGWKGDLAFAMMVHYGDAIIDWVNIEICEAAINKTIRPSKKYRIIKPHRFDWFVEERIEKPDVIIATHFIEHISNEHFDLLARYVSGVPVIYFEAPMEDDGQSWNGYMGTHKLTYGWNDVKRIMESYGYSNVDLKQGKIFLLKEDGD
jgi:hypothetical protein